jgi:hypothetical protein
LLQNHQSLDTATRMLFCSAGMEPMWKSRYGLYRVDFGDEALPRHARFSARWYSAFLKNNGIHVQSGLNNSGSHAE